jgi:hypothetical protein
MRDGVSHKYLLTYVTLYRVYWHKRGTRHILPPEFGKEMRNETEHVYRILIQKIQIIFRNKYYSILDYLGQGWAYITAQGQD